MCSPARCNRCGLTTWRGCGLHVDAVMSRVAPDERCSCPPQPRRSLMSKTPALMTDAAPLPATFPGCSGLLTAALAG